MSNNGPQKSGERPHCRRHNGELVTVFSTKHEKCMCLKCAMEQHDHLSDFVPISEGVDMMKAAGKNLMEEMTSMSEMAQTLKRGRTKIIENMRMSDKSIKAQIRKTRDSLTRHLDLMEQKMTNKLKSIMERSERAFLKDQSEIHKLETQLKHMKESVAKSMKTGNEMELISEIASERNAFLQKKLQVRELQEHMPFKNIHFRISSAILDFIKNVKDFGEVSLNALGDEIGEIAEYDTQTKPNAFHAATSPRRTHSQSYPGSNSHSPLSFKTQSNTANSSYGNRRQVDKYGIHASYPYHSMKDHYGNINNADISWRHERGGEYLDSYEDMEGVRDDPVILSSEHDGPCNLTGVASLTSGRVVVCDSKHKCLQLINRQSEILDQLVFHHKPCNIAAISENDFLVSFIEKDFVSVYSASLRALRHVRNLSVSGRGGSYSVAYSKNKIAVCRRGEVRIISLQNGDLINRIQIDAHFPQIAMSDGGNKIYLSDFVGGKVTCMNEQGRTKWEYGQEELEPCGLAVDLNQLFVADVKGKILIISTYGVLIRVIQCHGHLQAISVDGNTGTLCVTEESNRDKTKSRSIKIVAI